MVFIVSLNKAFSVNLIAFLLPNARHTEVSAFVMCFSVTHLVLTAPAVDIIVSLPVWVIGFLPLLQLWSMTVC